MKKALLPGNLYRIKWKKENCVQNMGNWISSPEDLPEEQTICQIQRECGFTQSQIIALWRRFQVLDTEKKNYLTRENFLSLPDLAINPVSYEDNF